MSKLAHSNDETMLLIELQAQAAEGAITLAHAQEAVAEMRCRHKHATERSDCLSGVCKCAREAQRMFDNGKREDKPDGRVFWTCAYDFLYREFNLKAAWYAFYWWDRSGDSRGGSNSGFYVRGFQTDGLVNTFNRAVEAFAFACDQFPQVVAGQKYPLVLQR